MKVDILLWFIGRYYISNQIYFYCLIVDHDPTYNCMNLLRTGLLQCKEDHDHWHWRPLEAGGH